MFEDVSVLNFERLRERDIRQHFNKVAAHPVKPDQELLDQHADAQSQQFSPKKTVEVSPVGVQVVSLPF